MKADRHDSETAKEGSTLTRQCYTYVDEQRESTRFAKEPESAYAVVFHPDLQELPAEVHDESLGGFALVLEDVTQFGVGQEVKIAYLDSLMKARVRHVEPREDGKYIVGFECTSTG